MKQMKDDVDSGKTEGANLASLIMMFHIDTQTSGQSNIESLKAKITK